MTNIPIQFEGVDDAVIHELCVGAHLKDVLAAKEAKEEQELLEIEAEQSRGIEGLGACTMTIGALQYHGWAKRFGTYDCWRDGHFKKYFLRKNPEAKAKGFTGTRPQIQCGFEGSNKRFSKTYADGSI